MADWKVSREAIELFPHPDAEKLELGKVGQYQVVVGKGMYKNGDSVIFAPDKSLLPDEIADKDDIRKYLSGSNKDRVKAIKLRGELSTGLILPDEERFKDIPIGQDISEQLKIRKYEPPIPVQLAGK